MELDPAWPARLRERLTERFGTPQSIEPLYGQSQNRIWAVHFANQTKVIKATRERWEYLFYEVATEWDFTRSLAPALEGCHRSNTEWWVALEWIPEPLPRHRWLADQEVLENLARLHQATSKFQDRIVARSFTWPESYSHALLGLLPPVERPLLEASLEPMRERAEHVLFAGKDFLSGDPNPTNWGLRADGSLVLFDWERFRHGSRAIDLAITIPGLGSREDYSLVAARYAVRSDEDPVRLADDIALAKIWSVAEFVHERSQHPLGPPLADSLRRKIEPWLRELIDSGWA